MLANYQLFACFVASKEDFTQSSLGIDMTRKKVKCDPKEKQANIGILGAFDGEVALLVKTMNVEQIFEIAEKQFYLGTLKGQRIVVVLSGVGLVNAAHTTQLLIDHFGVQRIIFTGIAGTLTEEIAIYDSLISTETQQFEADFTPLFPLGTIPFMKTSVFTADPELVQLAKIAASKLRKGRTFSGKIVSADKLLMPKEKQVFFKGMVMESEGAAVGHVCSLNHIPFVCIRTITDTQESVDSILVRAEKAATRSQRIVIGMLQLFQERK